MQFWKEMEGKTVAGRYALAALLRSEGRSAWFSARDDQQNPWDIFFTESSSEDDQLLKNLEAAGRVKHANVVGVEKSGRVRISDKSLLYAVMEPTEENLGDVLRERPLTAEETAEITSSLVAGLAAIHEQGLAHGQVNPANVLAAGDTVKLRSDCLRKVPVEGRTEAFGQDTGDLGATVFEALTQRKLTSPSDPAIEKLPVPFRSIVQSSVSGRWVLAEIAVALKKPLLEELRHPVPKVDPARPKFAEDTAARQGNRARPGKSEQGKAAQKKPAATVAPAVGAAGAANAGLTRKNGGAVRILALLAIVVALAASWYFYRNSQSSGTDSSTVTSNESTPAPVAAAPASAASAPTAPASAASAPTAPVAASPAPAAASVDEPSGSHKIWRVVVYTFSNQSAAAHKVRTLAAAHPDLKPEVFTATGHSPWLVTVGGPMDHEQAIRLRGEVRQQGLPGDSYAQNYSH